MPDPTAFHFRPINQRDDARIASIIRAVMPEFGACGSGFSSEDEEVDHMSTAYSTPRSAYFVVERDGRVVGGAGIAPLEGGDSATCELRKMYFLPEARGLGVGSKLLHDLLRIARGFGYRRCYLETLASMEDAGRLYERTGFRRLEGRLGDTGHGGCDRYYSLEL